MRMPTCVYNSSHYVCIILSLQAWHAYAYMYDTPSTYMTCIYNNSHCVCIILYLQAWHAYAYMYDTPSTYMTCVYNNIIVGL